MLSDTLHVTRTTPSTPTAEDIFAASLSILFPDDTATCHGEPGSVVTYTSSNAAHAPVDLYVRFDPEGEGERRLFAHYLWNAGIWVAESVTGGLAGVEEGKNNKWSVRDEIVLELGAGLALAGIMCAFAGAQEVTITDYPTDALLSAIKANVERIFAPRTLATNTTPTNFSGDAPTTSPKTTPTTTPTVYGHAWGDLTTPFATAHAHRYTRILAADCLWMPWQHGNLVRSMLHFLAFESTSPPADSLATTSHPVLKPASTPQTQTQAQNQHPPCIWVIAGFHTGRENVASFFEVALSEGLKIEERWEIDVEGRRRAWKREREDEGVWLSGC